MAAGAGKTLDVTRVQETIVSMSRTLGLKNRIHALTRALSTVAQDLPDEADAPRQIPAPAAPHHQRKISAAARKRMSEGGKHGAALARKKLRQQQAKAKAKAAPKTMVAHG